MRLDKLLFLSLMTVALVPAVSYAQTSTEAKSSDVKRADAFDHLDRTSRELIWTMKCAQATAHARAAGSFGPIDSLGTNGQCFRRNGRAMGVFFTPDSTFTRANRLRVVDLRTGARDAAPIDTAAILAVARASSDALSRAFPAFTRENRKFAPIAMRFEADSIQVWMLPVGMTVGGERAYVYSPNGRTLAREIDASDRFRAIVVPDSGRVVISSREDDLPLVSELVAMNLLHDRGRDVELVTAAFMSRLEGPRDNPVWVQIRRR